MEGVGGGRNHEAERRCGCVGREYAGRTHLIFVSTPDRYSLSQRTSTNLQQATAQKGGSAHMVSWGWLFDVGGGGNRTGGIGGLVQCAGATGAVRSTFVGLGGLGLARGCSAVADAPEPG